MILHAPIVCRLSFRLVALALAWCSVCWSPSAADEGGASVPRAAGEKIAAAADRAPSPRKSVATALDEGLRWLMAQQADDGGWHSETYGALRGGAAMTALALYAIAHVPESLREPRRTDVGRGFAFLQPGMKLKGCVACPDGSLDYPTYASAMTLVASRKLGATLAAEQRQALVDFLISAQLTEQQGFEAASPHYGGWDLLGASGAQGVTSGTNVSVTYFAAEALRDEASGQREAVLARALGWSRGCQNFPLDGGFYFHPEPQLLGNKAEWKDDGHEQPRSYGTATCDGLGCLLAAGADPNDKRVRAAIGWLEGQDTVKVVPGFEDAAPTLGWQEGLRFYYFQALARGLPLLSKAAARRGREKLIEAVLDLQRDDGRWQSDSSRMREDDPLIATALAIVALGRMQAQIGR